MKRYILLGLMLLPMTLFAELRVGYIDSRRIFDEYKGKTELSEKVQKKLNKWQQEAIAKKQEIENLIKEFESQSLMLSENVRAKKQRDIQQKQIKYEEYIQKIWGPEGEAQQQNEEIMKPFIDKVNSIIQKIGKEEKYTVIFDVANTGIVYAKEGLELTDQVIEELNKEFVIPEEKKEKIYFWVFRFKELTPDARDFDDGRQVAGILKAGFVKTDKFELVKTNKMSDALTTANIGKSEAEFTPEDASRVAELAKAEFVVIGEVTRIGEKVDIVCKIVDANTSSIIAQETGSTPKGEQEDLGRLIGEMVFKLVPEIESYKK
ncbi:OmpH family outer membrane protein [candidate division WOR-3 bacterium]|nr:OmpH family outer membrane protein [candidate division WOR-3 bacterium]